MMATGITNMEINAHSHFSQNTQNTRPKNMMTLWTVSFTSLVSDSNMALTSLTMRDISCPVVSFSKKP